MALARSRRLGIADLLGQKEVDLKKAAIFPQALLRGNDRCKPMREIPELQALFVRGGASCARKRRNHGACGRHPSTNIKTF
jgi:hypothetical protein